MYLINIFILFKDELNKWKTGKNTSGLYYKKYVDIDTHILILFKLEKKVPIILMYKNMNKYCTEEKWP